jgi:hypothetical protein
MGKVLERFKSKFSNHASASLGGGCDTCGYGAGEAMDDDDYASLLKEIDEWVGENFVEKDAA